MDTPVAASFHPFYLADNCSLSPQMLRMFAMFRQDSTPEQDFKYLHVFSRIDKCEKWTDVRRTLAKARETYQPDAPAPGAAAGRPDGNKKAKSARDAAPNAERLQASIEQCITDAKNHAVEREAKSDARWSAIFSTGQIKLDLLRTNVAAKKRNTDLAFLMAVDATAVSAMDGPIKEWYMRERGLILDGLPTDTPTATTNTSTRTASPSYDVSPTSTPGSPRTPTTDNDADAEADAETQDGAAEDIAAAVI